MRACTSEPTSPHKWTPPRNSGGIPQVSTRFSLSMEMSRLTRDGTAEPVSRDEILRHARGQGNVHFPCSADHEQDWRPYPVDPYSAICDDHTYIHTYISHVNITRGRREWVARNEPRYLFFFRSTASARCFPAWRAIFSRLELA